MNNENTRFEKSLADPKTTQESLLNLRDEIISKKLDRDHGVLEVLFKINSCLYSGYPLK